MQDVHDFDKFTDAIKSLVFELSCRGFEDDAERVNRLVLERGDSSMDDLFKLLTPLLQDVRARVPENFQSRVMQFEILSKNYRRVLGL